MGCNLEVFFFYNPSLLYFCGCSCIFGGASPDCAYLSPDWVFSCRVSCHSTIVFFLCMHVFKGTGHYGTTHNTCNDI